MKVRERETLWTKTGATHYNAQMGLPDKGCAIKRADCLLGFT